MNYTNTFKKPEKTDAVKSLGLWVHTTNSCCLRCSYCYIPTLGKNDYLTEESIEIFCNKLIQSTKANNLTNISLRLAGGEPFLRFDLWKPYLLQLKQELKDLNCELWVAFLTNAVLLTDEIIDFITENSFGIGVSMDGLTEYQDNTRHFRDGTGSFSIVSKNVMILKDKKCDPNIMTVVSNKNLDGLLDFTQYVIDNSLRYRFSLVKKEDVDIKKTIDTLTKCYNLFDKAIDNGYNFSKYHFFGDLKFGNPSIQTCSNAVNAAGRVFSYYLQLHLRRQIASVVKPVLSIYRFQTLGEFRALLSLYNIGVEDVQGTRAGQAYRGLLYTALNGDGQKAEVTPIKSSLLGKSCGYDALEKLMERSGAKIAGDNSRDHTRRRVADAFSGSPTGNELRERLRATHIDLYIRRNADGRITGATFIDHENRTVLNGSRLGKEYSANVLQERYGMELESGAGSIRQNTDQHLQPTPPTVSQAPETRQVRPIQRRTVVRKKPGRKL